MNKKYAGVLILCIGVLSVCGCVTRAITVKTTPSNALVYIDDKLVGESPVSVPFIYYGTRKITIEKRDADEKLTHERKVVLEKIKTPFYELFPLDFVSELVWPFNINDDHVLHYELVEMKPLSRKEKQKTVLENAQELRMRVDAPDF
ncbi:MAG: PEGA domain-containing protein [Planctomycetes bacterium]|nr:PEGA domain-containing protein [Planctomycetota bacterium]